jgi:NAD(P)H-hydrate epimerase
MKAIDKIAIEEYGIPGIVLMESAGREVASVAKQMLEEKNTNSVILFCGKGNNGGDGFVAARYLINAGLKPCIYIVGARDGIKKDSLSNLEILLRMGLQIHDFMDSSHLSTVKEEVRHSDLIIDAIFGTGLSGQLEGVAKETVEFLNELKIPILSVDIPSGLEADQGIPLGCAVKAVKTVTMAVAKKGFFVNEGPLFVGELSVADIGIPQEIIQKNSCLI